MPSEGSKPCVIVHDRSESELIVFAHTNTTLALYFFENCICVWIIVRIWNLHLIYSILGLTFDLEFEFDFDFEVLTLLYTPLSKNTKDEPRLLRHSPPPSPSSRSTQPPLANTNNVYTSTETNRNKQRPRQRPPNHEPQITTTTGSCADQKEPAHTTPAGKKKKTTHQS